MNPLAILSEYYRPGSRAYEILVSHSRSVRDKALALAESHPEMPLDHTFISESAMLHDIGIYLCDAPEIDCHGSSPYICHGWLGAELMRSLGYPRHALVCERHTGAGLSRAMIEARHLPIPPHDMLPLSLEEQLICFADKFFSKTKLEREKPIEKIRHGLAAYGQEDVKRFDGWCKIFL